MEPEDSGVTLDSRTLRGRVERRDGDLVCVLGDEDTEIEIRPGLDGDAIRAVHAARLAATVLLQYAEALRAEAGQRAPVVPVQTAPEPGLSDVLPRGKTLPD